MMGPDTERVVREAAPRLKVFPLPSVVLLPGTAVPLHIFEPRYRALLKDCLAGDRVMALADLQPGWEDNYAGRPALRPVACAGVVAWDETLPDGRMNIILQGVSRVRVVQELENDKLYREVVAEPWEDPAYEGPLEELVRRAVLEVAGRLDGEVADTLMQLATRAEGGMLADAVAAAIVTDVEARQGVLAELDPGKRLEHVLDAVQDVIARMGAAAPGGLLN